MRNKLIIPVCVFILGQLIYDVFGEIQNTNWSIYYYSMQYICWLLLVILLPKPHVYIKKIPYFVLASGLIFYIGIEFSKIGMDYKEYYLSVNEFNQFILPITTIIAGLTYFIIKLCRQ
jgi:uncharacterized membrane protein YoaK (UPF0700 family)